MRNIDQISIRVSKEVKEAARKAADDDHRSVASLTGIALVDFLRRNGKLPEPIKKAAKK